MKKIKNEVAYVCTHNFKKLMNSDFEHFFEGGTKMKILSEI